MKAKPYINMCRNVNIIEQVLNSPGKRGFASQMTQGASMNAALFAKDRQADKIEDLFNDHIESTFQKGIDKHGHWDLTKSDADGVINPAFAEYFRQVQSIDPRANKEEHFRRFDDVITRKAGELHGYGRQEAENKYKKLGSMVASKISNIFFSGK